MATEDQPTADGVRSRLARLDALVLTAAIWFLAKFLRYLFPPLFPTLAAQYSVSNAVLGGAFTALMLAYAATQLPSGMLADRVGGWRVVTAGAVLAALAALAIASPIVLGSPLPFPVLVAAMVVVGVGTGAHKTVAVPLLSLVYTRKTGRALGVLDTFGALPGVVAPVAIVATTTGVLAGVVDWPVVFFAAGIVGLALAGAFAWRVPRRVPASAGSPDDDATGIGAYAALFADRDVAIFVGVTVLFSFTFNGAVAFLPTYLVETASLSEGTAGVLYAALFAVSVVQIATGAASDTLGRLPVIGAALTFAALGLAVLVVAPAAPVLVLGAAIVSFGLGSHGFRPVRSAYLVDLVPEDVAGGALGAVRTAIMVVGAISPATVGVLAESFGFQIAFGVLLASHVGALALLLAVAAFVE